MCVPLRLDIQGENCRPGEEKAGRDADSLSGGRLAMGRGCSRKGFWEFEEPDPGGAWKAVPLVLNLVLRAMKATVFL